MDNGFETVSLGDYVGVVWRRKWIVLLVTLLLAGAATLYAKHQQTLYSATSQVLYSPTSAPATQQANNKSLSGNAGAWANSNVALASSQTFDRYVLGRLKLADRTPADLQAQTTVAVDATGNNLIVTVSDPNQGTATRLAAAIANSFPMFLVSQGVQATITKDQGLILQDIAALQGPKAEIAAGLIMMSAGAPVLDKNGNEQIDPAKVGKTKLDLANKRNIIAQDQAKLTNLTPTQAGDIEYTVAEPSTGATQTQPQVAKTVAIGAFIGLVLGMFLAFLQDVLDTRIRDAEDVGRRLRLPLLARIPSPPKAVGNGLVALADPAPPLVPSSEAYRIAKLNLASVLNRNPDVRTIMFTSAGDDEGTSQTAANLAIVLARSGKHVILVDANLRRPVQGEFFGLDDRAGLSDVLAGRARLADALTGVDVGRHGAVDAAANGRGAVDGILEVLPAGAATVDAAELLDSRTATELVLTLRSRADIVLIDAPAMLPVTDAMVLASKVDGVIVVSRARLASRPTVVALRRALDNCPAPGVGFVFTGASPGARNDYGGSYVVPRPTPGFGEDEREPREVGVL